MLRSGLYSLDYIAYFLVFLVFGTSTVSRRLFSIASICRGDTFRNPKFGTGRRANYLYFGIKRRRPPIDILEFYKYIYTFRLR